MPVPVKIFISYAHKDAPYFEVFKQDIKTHLKSSSLFDFSAWEDSDLPLGSNWDDEIQKNLGSVEVAILCVSANFLNSRYIRSDEFERLLKRYPKTLVVPIYFNHCNINAWEDLAIKQFFKPPGDRYGEAAQPDFAFCDLVGFRTSDGLYIPNPNIDLYLQDFVKKLELSLLGTEEKDVIRITEPAFTASINTPTKKEKKITDKIVEAAILSAIVLSLGFIIYTLAFNAADAIDAKKFNGTIGCAMFFGSSGLFVFNRKNQHS
jgi:hypothetical protein